MHNISDADRTQDELLCLAHGHNVFHVTVSAASAGVLNKYS